MTLPVFFDDMRSVDSMQITPIHRIAAIHFLITSACGELNKFRAYYSDRELPVSKSGARADVPSLRDSSIFAGHPGLPSWAILCRPFGAGPPGSDPEYEADPVRNWASRVNQSSA